MAVVTLVLSLFSIVFSLAALALVLELRTDAFKRSITSALSEGANDASTSSNAAQVSLSGAPSLGLHHPSLDDLEASSIARAHQRKHELWNPYGA